MHCSHIWTIGLVVNTGLVEIYLLLITCYVVFHTQKKGSCNISVLWTVTLTQYEATTPSLTSVLLGPCTMPFVLINLDHGDLKVVVDPLFIIIRLILILWGGGGGAENAQV